MILLPTSGMIKECTKSGQLCEIGDPYFGDPGSPISYEVGEPGPQINKNLGTPGVPFSYEVGDPVMKIGTPHAMVSELMFQ